MVDKTKGWEARLTDFIDNDIDGRFWFDDMIDRAARGLGRSVAMDKVMEDKDMRDYDEGYNAGRDEALDEGYEAGYEAGYSVGFDEGKEAAKDAR